MSAAGTVKTSRPRRYECCIPKWCDQAPYGCKGCGVTTFFTASDMRPEEVIAASSGKARYEFLLRLRGIGCSDVSFADVKVRALGPVVPAQTDGMKQLRSCYPSIPPLQAMMPVVVHGCDAVIVGANSAYLHVMYVSGSLAGMIDEHVHPLSVDYLVDAGVTS